MEADEAALQHLGHYRLLTPRGFPDSHAIVFHIAFQLRKFWGLNMAPFAATVPGVKNPPQIIEQRSESLSTLNDNTRFPPRLGNMPCCRNRTQRPGVLTLHLERFFKMAA